MSSRQLHESLSDSVYWLYASIGIRDLAKDSDLGTGTGGANTSGSSCCILDIARTKPTSFNESALEENTSQNQDIMFVPLPVSIANNSAGTSSDS